MSFQWCFWFLFQKDKSPRRCVFFKCFLTTGASMAHRIHVWYIHLHLVDFYGKCRWIYHTWILWVVASDFNKNTIFSDYRFTMARRPMPLEVRSSIREWQFCGDGGCCLFWKRPSWTNIYIYILYIRYIYIYISGTIFRDHNVITVHILIWNTYPFYFGGLKTREDPLFVKVVG